MAVLHHFDHLYFVFQNQFQKAAIIEIHTFRLNQHIIQQYRGFRGKNVFIYAVLLSISTGFAGAIFAYVILCPFPEKFSLARVLPHILQ